MKSFLAVFPRLVALMTPAALHAQLQVSSFPAVPMPGTLIRLEITLPSSDTAAPEWPEAVRHLEGVAAGEPLHFRAISPGRWTGYAGVPVDGADSLVITLFLIRGGDGVRDSVTAAIALSPTEYPTERLTVAPRMAEPDSAARARIRREAARARAVGRASHLTPALRETGFLLPLDSRITSTFGTGRTFNGRRRSRHLGTDFAGVVGDTILAPAGARVAMVARFYLAGRVVYLDHGEGLTTAYFHLSRALVREGDLVTPGQPIGLVGATGRVTGPHLHWVMRYGGITVDPMSGVELERTPEMEGPFGDRR